MAENHTVSFDLKKAIELSQGISMPIKGGPGLYEDDPIVFTERHHATAVSLEQAIVEQACVYYGFWKAQIINQELVQMNDIHLDVITVEWVDSDDAPKTAKLYFDISLPFANAGKTREELGIINKDADLTVDVEIIEDFPSAVHWSLHRALSTNEFRNISIETVKEMYYCDEQRAKQILKGLEACGALKEDSGKLFGSVD